MLPENDRGFVELLLSSLSRLRLLPDFEVQLVVAESHAAAVWRYLDEVGRSPDGDVQVVEVDLPALLLASLQQEDVAVFLESYAPLTMDERVALGNGKLTARLVAGRPPRLEFVGRQVAERAGRGASAVVEVPLGNQIVTAGAPSSYTLSRWLDLGIELWEKCAAVLRRVSDLVNPSVAPRYTAAELLDLFTQLIQEGHSDWHVIAGREIRVRAANGNMEVIQPGRIVNEEDLLDLLFEMTRFTTYMQSIERLYRIHEDGRRYPDFTQRLPPEGVNFAYSFVDGNGRLLGRLRINVHLVVPIGFERKWRGLAFSARRIPHAPPDPVTLGFHPAALRLVTDIVEQRLTRGLVLIVGPTGSGKTHTMAAIVQQLNQKKPVNIISIEDPVEVIYPDGKATIQQIEIGSCVGSYKEAGLNAKRQDPDVIAIGEIRDSETALVAVELALTGHLVLATMHAATTTYDAIPKLLEFGPSRSSVAQALQAVIAQRLIFARHLGTAGEAAQRRLLVMEVARLSSRNQIREMILQEGPLDRERFYEAIDYDQSEEFSISLEESLLRLVIQQQLDVTGGLLIAEHKARYMTLLVRLYEELRKVLQERGVDVTARGGGAVSASPEVERNRQLFLSIQPFVENYLAARRKGSGWHLEGSPPLSS